MTKFINKTEDVKLQIARALTQALEKVVFNTEASIVKGFRKFPKPPIDTGDLMGSITGEVVSPTKGIVSAGGNLEKEYAIYVEYGTLKMPARPYFRNGIADAEKENIAIIRKALTDIQGL